MVGGRAGRAQDGSDLEVLRVVTEERNTYGLRHQDFSRYRSHCTRKVHNLRKAAGVSQVKGKKYAKKDVTVENAQTYRHFLVPLFQAERAWAYSRERRESVGPQAVEKADSRVRKGARVRHHASNRLSRAVAHAADVLSLLPASADPSCRAQAHSYSLYLRGLLHFERSEWEKGLACLASSMTLLLDLADRPGVSAHEVALANEWVDEVSPLARFCAYKLDVTGDVAVICRQRAEAGGGAKCVEGWDALQAELKKGDGSPRRVTDAEWRGVKIDVRNAELADAFANVETTLEQLAALRTRVASKASAKHRRRPDKPRVIKAMAFDSALLTLNDAEEVARRLVDDNTVALSRSHSARFEASTVPLRNAHAYVAWHLLSVRIERDMALVREESEKLARREGKIKRKAGSAAVARNGDGKLARKRARNYPSLVKLYDTIVLSLEQMRDLSLVVEDLDVSADVDARIAYICARRCAVQARTYDILCRFPEALSLNQRAKLYIRQSRSHAAPPLSVSANLDDEEVESVQRFLPVSEADLAALEGDLDLDHHRFSRRWFDRTGGGKARPDHLSVGGLSLSDRKRKIKKKKAKPAVFDVAFNYAASLPFDELAVRAGIATAAPLAPLAAGPAPIEGVVATGEADQVEASTAPAGKKGLWGFFSRT